jgi:hypothetical protein
LIVGIINIVASAVIEMISVDKAWQKSVRGKEASQLAVAENALGM